MPEPRGSSLVVLCFDVETGLQQEVRSGTAFAIDPHVGSTAGIVPFKDGRATSRMTRTQVPDR